MSRRSLRMGISNRAEERVRLLARIKATVLYHDGHVGLDHAGIIGIVGHWLRRYEIVEADVLCSARGHNYFIGPDRLLIGKENRDTHMRFLIACIQDARGLVAGHLRLGPVAPSWDVAFSNSPCTLSDRLHAVPLSNAPEHGRTKIQAAPVCASIKHIPGDTNEYGVRLSRSCIKQTLYCASKIYVHPFAACKNVRKSVCGGLGGETANGL